MCRMLGSRKVCSSMLNELYTLDRSLKRFNVVVENAHPWVKRLGRADVLIAGVDTLGIVNTAEHLSKGDAVTLFKIQASNHANFPAVNWSAPIWRLDIASPVSQEWLACPVEDLGRRVQLLRQACQDAEFSLGQDRVLSRVQEFCRELVPRFKGSNEGEFSAFPMLLERLGAITVPAAKWLQALTDAVLKYAADGSAHALPTVETLLIGQFNKKTNKFEDTKIPMLFDLADCTKFRYRVANPRMGAYFSRQLNATQIAGTVGGRCALSGLEIPLESEKMPSPRLPVLGDTVLMSMNPDTPCQTRYGRTGMDIFPLGKHTAAALNTALLHLTTPDRERQNWKRIPATTRKKFNLLLVYLESSPQLEADIAELFSGTDDSDRLYATVCAQVCEALSGRAAHDNDLVHLFVLNKIDPGRVQVELSETFTPEQVVRGGAEWMMGAGNRPQLPLRGDDYIPSPSDVMRCLQMTWERGGASYSDCPGCNLADVYDLLIAGRPRARDSAQTLLRVALNRATDLLLAVGHAAHRGGKEAWKAISREAGKNPVIAVSLLGITLSKLECRKEKYMQEPAFLVGRFLSLADTLHAEYSRSVRKDSPLPPQLLGNALIPTALNDPNKGLARMLLRIRVYQAWARGSKGTGLARWSCNEIGKIANELEGKLGTRRFSEPEQAQLLLGYLARTESKHEEANEKGVN